MNDAKIRVNIVNGHLDLVIAHSGTVKWINKIIKWNGEKRKTIVVDDILEGYYKQHKLFTFYTVLRSGHMVPADNPVAMEWILKHFIEGL